MWKTYEILTVAHLQLECPCLCSKVLLCCKFHVQTSPRTLPGSHLGHLWTQITLAHRSPLGSAIISPYNWGDANIPKISCVCIGYYALDDLSGLKPLSKYTNYNYLLELVSCTSVEHRAVLYTVTLLLIQLQHFIGTHYTRTPAHTQTHTRAHTRTRTHARAHTQHCAVLAPQPGAGHVVSFFKQAKPDRTNKLKAPPGVERQIGQFRPLCLTRHLWAKKISPIYGSSHHSEREGWGATQSDGISAFVQGSGLLYPHHLWGHLRYLATPAATASRGKLTLLHVLHLWLHKT